MLTEALGSKQPGSIATAAQVISVYPARAQPDKSSDGPSAAIITRLQELLTVPEKNDQIPAETRAAVIETAGALRVLSLKPAIEKLCGGDNVALHEPAARALSLLGATKPTCQHEKKVTSTDSPRAASPATIVIDSDVGELVLHIDPRDAPASTARFLQLVDAGFYNGLSVHGARAGFAVQFGDKDLDGYEDTPSPALPNEVSPEPFGELSAGMTAFSPGSQDSQIFVLVSDAPQLFGSRVRLGTAEGPWHLLVVGDVFHSVKRR